MNWRKKLKKGTQYKNTDGLAKYAEARNKQTIDAVNSCIDRMKRNGEQVTFDSVAKKAGVSRSTLYNNPCLKERIQGLRSLGMKKTQSNRESDEAISLKDREKELRERIRILEKDKKNLIAQLVDYMDICDENKRLKKRLEELNDESELC